MSSLREECGVFGVFSQETQNVRCSLGSSLHNVHPIGRDGQYGDLVGYCSACRCCDRYAQLLYRYLGMFDLHRCSVCCGGWRHHGHTIRRHSCFTRVSDSGSNRLNPQFSRKLLVHLCRGPSVRAELRPHYTGFQ